MIKENKVSLWLGVFENPDEFENYVNISYDEQGNQKLSEFQKNYKIEKYDFDGIETDFLSDQVLDVKSLFEGFSWDYEIIPQFKKMLEHKNLNYNSIVLLYNFEYTGNILTDGKLEYIGCADFTGEL